MKITGKNIKEFVIITLATILTALPVYFIMLPSHVLVGSVTALAVILCEFIPLPVSVVTMILNVVLLVLGFIFIGRDFGVKTVYTSLLMPVVLNVLEHLFPNPGSLMGDPFQDMICYVFFVSIGLALLFNCNASSGGLDIVAKFLNKFFKVEMGAAMAASGMAVAVSSILVYDLRLTVLSVLGTYLSGVVLDRFIFGLNVKKRVCIMSDKCEELRQFILKDLHSGATIYETKGAYNMASRQEILTIVDKNEYMKLMNFVEKTDPAAFVTIYNVDKVIYRPKA